MWETKKIIIFLLPFALLAIGVAVWFFLRKTLRSRRRVAKQLRDDTDINEFLVVFNWSRKILYIPTIAMSLLASLLMGLREANVWIHPNAQILGGVWLAVFFLNFLMDEYELSIKILLIGLLCVALLGLWLAFMGWFMPFLRLFRHLGIVINWTGYLIIAMIFLLAVAVAWVR